MKPFIECAHPLHTWLRHANLSGDAKITIEVPRIDDLFRVEHSLLRDFDIVTMKPCSTRVNDGRLAFRLLGIDFTVIATEKLHVPWNEVTTFKLFYK